MENKVFKLSDDAILMIRELIQFSILTGTNIVDHFRGMRLESPDGVALTVTEEYVTAYNSMISKMNDEMVAQQLAAQQNIVTEG